MAINIDLIKQIRPIIEREELWNQGAWRMVLIQDENGNWVSFLDSSPIENPKLLEEATHRCNTAMCVAGWAVELDPRATWALDAEHSAKHEAGILPRPDESGLPLPSVDDVVIKDPSIEAAMEARRGERICYNGERIRVYDAEQVGRELLGLDDFDSGWLFDSGRDKEEILTFFDLVTSNRYDPTRDAPEQVYKLINDRIDADDQ